MCPNANKHTPEAKSRCFGCSHPELLASSEEEEAEAQRLYRQGYKCVSNKYHRVQLRVASGASFQVEGPNAPDVASVLSAFTPAIEEEWRRRFGPEPEEVSAGVYRALKRLEKN